MVKCSHRQSQRPLVLARSERVISSSSPPIPKWRDAVAGAFAGALSKTAMAPVERIKLLMQLQGSVSSGSPQQSSRSNPWKVGWQIYRQEGILAFWRGNWPNVVRTAGQAALNLSLMDYYKAVATSPIWEAPIVAVARRKTRSSESPVLSADATDLVRQKKFIVSLVSGGLAGATSTTVLYPMEFLRTRLAMDQGRSLASRQYTGMRDAVMQTLRSDGVVGMYQGYGIAVVGSILYRLLFLGGYDALKTEFLYMRQLRHHSSSAGGSEEHIDITFFERFVMAQTISLTAGTICYPIDSVRRRLMMQTGQPMELRKYKGSWHCFQAIGKTEGLRGFYLGLTPNLVRSIGGALMLVAYDTLKGLL